MTGHELHDPAVTDLIKPAVNFTLFAGLIVYAVRVPISTFFRDRTAKIRAALEAGARAKSDAEALRVQLERDTAVLPELCASMVAEMRETAERERALLLEKARQTAERIRQDATLAGEQEGAAARSELREKTVQRAILEAVRLVREAVTAEDQARTVQEFVQSVRTL
jgi:F-type H+-transporting ATPase subunit b